MGDLGVRELENWGMRELENEGGSGENGGKGYKVS